jgi:hypothetical protein
MGLTEYPQNVCKIYAIYRQFVRGFVVYFLQFITIRMHLFAVFYNYS